MKSLKPLGKRRKVRSEKELLAELRGVPTPENTSPKEENNPEETFTLEDIKCIDADGTTKEEYDVLFVNKDNRKKPNGEFIYRTYMDTLTADANISTFVPGIALTFNILAKLLEKNDDSSKKLIKKLLKPPHQIVNTVVNWQTGRIINYPQIGSFPENLRPGYENVNEYQYDHHTDFNCLPEGVYHLSDVNNNSGFERYVKNLTCIRDLDVIRGLQKVIDDNITFHIPDPKKIKLSGMGIYGTDAFTPIEVVPFSLGESGISRLVIDHTL